MGTSAVTTSLSKRLERSLALACQAEFRGDYLRAGRAFVIALLCEGRLRPDVQSPWDHVFKAMPVY